MYHDLLFLLSFSYVLGVPFSSGMVVFQVTSTQALDISGEYYLDIRRALHVIIPLFLPFSCSVHLSTSIEIPEKFQQIIRVTGVRCPSGYELLQSGAANNTRRIPKGT